ncbi:MAG TPA: S1 RNA-binding domain-containing protein [Acidimicrobiales bacterium]|nr:S1 RNA-binding domain-containing protein [Acidimicrobiales bacterium]
MAYRRVVVDGSNIATEGRSVPSLAQLDEAVREFQREFPDAEVTVVVDASFGHRIDESERPAFDEAEAHGEIVSPPAGAIGRGDAFLLRIAEKTGATVLSNDSFQEFHGEHDWLFSQSRLVGGKPVPSVGWIFTARTPVRGPRSRVATQDAKRTRVRVGSKEASKPMPVPAVPPPGRGRRDGGPKEPEDGAGAVRDATPPADPKVRQAIAAATEEVVSPQTSSGGRRRRRGSGPPPQAVNDPLTFIRFIAEHPLGQLVEGEVESFTSHGAFVRVQNAQAYVPVSGLGDPPPRSARRALRRGERRPFVLQALDPQRRGVELALPEFAHVAGSPSEETVEAEISEATGTDEVVPDAERGAARKRVQKATAPEKASEKAKDGKGRRRAGKGDGPAQQAKAATTKKAKAGAAKKAKAGAAKKAKAAPAKAAAKTAAKAGKTTKPSKATKAPVTKSPVTKSPASKSPVAKTQVTKTRVSKAPATKAKATKKTAEKATKKATKDASAGATAGAEAKAPVRTATARASEGRAKK